MTVSETRLIGKRGSVIIPERLREQVGIEEGAVVLLEEREGGIFIRPLNALIETYSPQRQAELLLNNAVDTEDYDEILAEVRRLGIDPATIAHQKPPGV